MKTYWVTFRLEDDFSYEHRYTRLNNTLLELADGKYWNEPTSFFAFMSAAPTDDIVSVLRSSIDLQTDLVVLGAFETKTCRIIGKIQDNDLLRMVEFAKKE